MSIRKAHTSLSQVNYIFYDHQIRCPIHDITTIQRRGERHFKYFACLFAQLQCQVLNSHSDIFKLNRMTISIKGCAVFGCAKKRWHMQKPHA